MHSSHIVAKLSMVLCRGSRYNVVWNDRSRSKGHLSKTAYYFQLSVWLRATNTYKRPRREFKLYFLWPFWRIVNQNPAKAITFAPKTTTGKHYYTAKLLSTSQVLAVVTTSECCCQQSYVFTNLWSKKSAFSILYRFFHAITKMAWLQTRKEAST